MEIKRTIKPIGKRHIPLFSGILMLVIILLVNGCNKETTNPTNNQYLVDFNEENLFLLQSIEAMLSPLEPLYPQAAGIKENAAYSVQVFSINYKTHYKGEEITASGLVCLPLADEQFPLISFQNGTNTYHGNAPTANPLNFNYLLLEAMASNGYIILIPDYIGFGASSDQVHPYYQKETTNSTVIDMMHACSELVQDKEVLAKMAGRNYLMGYSQGGWATLSVLEELEKGDHSDIQVTAASCGAGAYDLMAMSNYVLALDTFPGPVYLPYFVYSEQIYGALTDGLDKYFNEPYAERIPGLFDGTHTNGEVNENLNDTISRLLTSDMIQNFASGTEYQDLRNVLTENSVLSWPVEAQVRFYHGTIDINVPPIQSQMIYDRFIASGADPSRVSLLPLEGMTHETGVISWGINSINWFNELEGK
jgi:pimeloyl-ACP methyl ester carboxylesterase